MRDRERVSAAEPAITFETARETKRTVSLQILLLSLLTSMIFSFYLGVYFRSNKRTVAGGARLESVLAFGAYEQCEASPSSQDEDESEGEPMAPALISFDVRPKNCVFFGSKAQDELRKAVSAILNATAMKLLWFHCQPSQVENCVGILANGSLSLYPVPKANVILFDLFLDDELQDLASLLLAVQKAFMVKPVDVTWSVTRRALAPQDDAAIYIRSTQAFKQHVASVQTDFQLIDVYEACLPKDNYRKCRLKPYIQSLNSDENSYESRYPEYFRPDRYLFLDGVMQSVRFGESAYHEALVHPALFAHPHPRRAAIIGGGEGATLREILKHNTIEEAIMVEIDEIMVNVSRQYLPEWSDCSDLVGSAEWCGDDPRASIYYEDAIGWFISHYGDKRSEEAKIDVIIMDALDPESDVPFARALYDDDRFMEALHFSLSSEGIIVMQLGEAPSHDDPPDSISMFINRSTIRNLLARFGFETLHVFDEAHGGYGGPWSFLAAFKSQKTRERWYASDSQVEEYIARRLVRTKSGKSPLRYFDGPTMSSYQIPSRAFERVFCRERPHPEECELSGGLNPYFLHVTENDVELGPKGDGVFSKVDIPEGPVHLMLKSSAHSVGFEPEAQKLLQMLKTDGEKMLFDFSMQSPIDAIMSSGPLLFAKEECTNLTNIRYGTIERKCYSPVIERHQSRHTGTKALKDIRSGDELIIDAC